MATEECGAIHHSPTATGKVEVRCTKPRGHEGKHQGKTGPFPISWD